MLDDMDLFLNPEPGGPNNHPQWNINCDQTKSDFNQIVVRTLGCKYFQASYDKIQKTVIFKSDNDPANEKTNVYFSQILEKINRFR
jgi:hypothetical protein